MLLTSISNWDSRGMTWSICMNVIHKLMEGFTSSLGRPLSGLSRVSPSPIKG